MKQTGRNKLLLVLLAVAMVIMLLPTVAFAEEGDEAIVEKTVSTAEELEDALNGNDKNIVITVSDDIELFSGIKISEKRKIVLQGATRDVKITFADSIGVLDADTDHSMFYFENGANVFMTVQNIILDGAKKGRLFCLGNAGNGTKNKLTLEIGATLQNGYPRLAVGETGNQPSGGAVRMMNGSELVMNSGKIINNTSSRYGGGIFAWASDVVVEINGGEISGNTGSYAGGIVLLGQTQLFLHGGKVINNIGTTIHGGGIFYQDGTMYIGGEAVVCDNKLSNKSLSDIFLNQQRVNIYIDSALTGDIAFTNQGLRPEEILAVDDYNLTESDANHLRISSGNRIFYLDTDTQTIKQTTSHTVKFHYNTSGNSITEIQKVPSGYPYMLRANTFDYEGYIFDGWNTQSDGKGTTYKNCEEVTFSQDIELYAMWRALDAVPKELATEYSSEISIPVSDNAIVLKNLTSSDASIVSVNDGKLKAEHVGEAVITATATTENGGETEVKINVKVTPMLITYGSTGDDVIGWDHTYNRPAVVYSQPVGENEEQLSDHIWFYPAKESVDADSGEKIYIPDTEAAHIELEQGKDFTFSYTQNGNHVESTGVLPFLETLDSEGNSEAIDVIVDLQNENYQFVTIGTLWKPWDQILLRVTVMAEGMERISMMNGDELLQNSLEKRILEYTGEGVAPAYDLTGISAEDIEEFTVHFHSVIEGISYDTHLYNKQPAELSADAVQAIAPKELGVYSMVANGQNDEAKKYAYVSRRFEITKGNPTGEPEFDAVDSNVELSAIELSGSMKNAAGKPVEGVFEWIDDSQTVEQGVGYAWRFTPDDTEHYNGAEGESVVYPEEKPGSDKEDLAALIEYAQDAKNAENYKYVVPKVKELFEKALEDAIAVNAKEDATQKEIDAAYDALLAKVHLLDFTGNTESLTVLVGTASGKVEAMYTKESWAPFAEALKAAQGVLADENALQEEIDTARDVLQAAMDALVENPIDTSKLEKLVADASVYEENLENYIPSTAESFMAALDGAREVLASSEITQDAVNSAYATLLNAIFGLREVPNKDRLEELLGKVEAMDLSSYSEETANAVKAAVAMAAAVMEDENANQKQVDAAVAALEEAVASLEAKEEVGTDDINTDNTEDTSGEDESCVTDKKVAANDEGSKDTANKTTTAKTNAKTAAQTGDAAKAAVPAVAAAAALLAVWFVWKKK